MNTQTTPPPRQHAESGLREATCSDFVAALFTRRDSIYKTMDGVDAWDIDRDALNYAGDLSVIAHPPCRAWGGLAHMANPRPGEKELALWAVAKIREVGGVLEHPIASKLWPAAGLPEPGERDDYGGFTVEAQQYWWGHPAAKWTRFYICGCEPDEIPPIPFRDGRPPKVVSTGHGLRLGHPNFRSRCSDKEREATPPALAEWLVAVAKSCYPNSGVRIVQSPPNP